MREFHRIRKNRNWFYSWPVLIVLVVLVAVFTKSTFDIFQKRLDSSRVVEKTESELRILREQEERLHSEINYPKTEKGVEEAIREKFSVAKEDERVIVIIPSVGTSTDNPTPSLRNRFWTMVGDLFGRF